MPIRYAVGMHQYALRVRLRGVDDGEGREYETSISYEDNLMKIRIGSPEYTVQGPTAVPPAVSRRAGHPLGGQPRLGTRQLRRAPLERHGDGVAGADRRRRR